MIQLLLHMCLNPVTDVSLETPGGDKQKKREVKKGRNKQINNIQQRKFMRRKEGDGLDESPQPDMELQPTLVFETSPVAVSPDSATPEKSVEPSEVKTLNV